MPRPDSPPLTRGVVLRGFLLTIAVGLGGVAVWLVVTSTTRKWMEIGVLCGLWAALVGAFAMFGPRRFMHPLEFEPEPYASTALELRDARAELERAEEATARRAYEARLEHMLRREIRNSVAGEVAALRAEIADLRSELLEKVGGQLRLERIETTRVIGSDLEALQAEVRQLKAAAQDVDFGAGRARVAEPVVPVRQIVEPARVRPVTRQTAEVEADVQPARAAAPFVPAATPPPSPPPSPPQPPPPPAAQPVATQPASPPAAPPSPTPTPAPAAASGHVDSTGPIRLEPPQVEPPPAPRPQPAPPPQEAVVLPLQPGDEFAGLPRIRPFTDFELDPVEPPAAAYTGRRRRPEDDDGERGAGRHARPPAGPERRHRRAEDTGDDLLARLLAREGH